MIKVDRTYHIHVYDANTDGQQYFLGEGIENVQ